MTMEGEGATKREGGKREREGEREKTSLTA